MGCSQSSSGPELRLEDRFSADVLSLLVGGTGSSPPPTKDLTTCCDLTTIDGVVWGELLRAGFAYLVKNKAECNRINVFPVPDGDTGTNMCLAVQGGVQSYGEDGPNPDITAMAEAFSAKVLLCAQGNSGTILSSIFMELAKNLSQNGRKKELTLSEFRTMFSKIGDVIMACMPDAQVGTMISVVKESSEGLAKSKDATLGKMIDTWTKEALASLARTPDQLVVDGKYVLRNAGVVDSGAKGYVLLLEGMQMALAGTLEYGEYFSQTKDTEALDHAVGGESASNAAHDHALCDHDGSELEFRFCTECVVQLEAGATSDALTNAVSHLGDSIVPVVAPISETASLGKLHIHTNSPESVFAAVRKLSATRNEEGSILLKEKVDDMADQVRVAGHVHSSYQPPDMAHSKVCIVWGSSADVPESFRQKFEAWEVPLKLTIDDVSYDDRVEMPPQTMFNLQRIKAYKSMSTGGASPKTFETVLKRACDTSEKPEVLVIVLQRSGSAGTWAGVTGGIKMLPPALQARTHLFMTNHTTVHEGALVMRAHELAAKGYSAAQIITDLAVYERDHSLTALTIQDVSYGRKTGRLKGGLPECVLNYLEKHKSAVVLGYRFQKYKKDGNAKPDIIALAAKPPAVREKTVKYFAKHIAKADRAHGGSMSRQYDVILAHTARPDSCRELEALLRQHPLIGPRIRHVHLAVLGGVLGVHFGPGGSAVEFAPVINDLLVSDEAVGLNEIEISLRQAEAK